jgi:hypothetical protein
MASVSGAICAMRMKVLSCSLQLSAAPGELKPL